MALREPNIIIIHHPKIKKNKCLQDILSIRRHIVLGGKHNNLLSLAAACTSIKTPTPPQCILSDGLKNWPGVDFVIIIALHNEHPEEVFTEINRKTLTMVVCCGIADE